MTKRDILPARHRNLLLEKFPKGAVFFDLETTGLSPFTDEIIEIGAYKITPEGDSQFQELIKPSVTIPPETTAIHGITDAMVKNEKSRDEVLPPFLEFIGDLPLIAHNAKFDVGFIIFNAHKMSNHTLTNTVHCSCYLSRKTVNSQNHKLKTLVNFYQIKLENHHRALDDAIACMEVFAHNLDDIDKSHELNSDASFLCQLNDFKTLENFELPSDIEKFKDYVFQQTPMAIRYKGGSLKMVYRPIKPASLLPLPNGPVLYALCLVTKKHKSFALKKIKDIKILREKELNQLIVEGKKKLELSQREKRNDQVK